MKKGWWEEYAKVYDRIICFSSLYNELLDMAANTLSLEGRILEVGCGTGNLLSRLNDGKNRVLYGIDSSSDMLRLAEEKVPDAGLFEGDAARLPFKEAFFDGVACLNVLYAVKNPQKVIDEAYRVLKHNGVYVVSGPKPNQNFSLLVNSLRKDVDGRVSEDELFLFIEINKRLIENARLYENKDVVEMLESAGFSVTLNSSAYLGQAYFVVAQK